MNSAAEAFTLQLARASRQATRFLRTRGLNSDDRNDVISTAVLWCWENRDNYSLTATLEQWFLGAVKNAYTSWARGERLNGATEIVQEMGGKDDPEYNVMLQDAVRALESNMDEIDRAVVRMRLDDKTHSEISTALKIERSAITKRLNKLSAQLPSSAHVNTILRRVVGPTDSDNASDALSQIDKDIAALEFAPAQGKECPPCWRCKWFEGYLPGPRKDVRMDINERSVKAAVLWTERRKKRIAQEVRDGNL